MNRTTKNDDRSRRTLVSLAAAAAGTLLCTSNAHAWLGGFENNDGYQPFLNMVQNYNAGHYGPNSGYGADRSPSRRTPTSGPPSKAASARAATSPTSPATR